MRAPAHASAATPYRQRGSAMIEFAVVGPLITLLGTTVLQYALMFNAKNLVNHAGHMAARSGTMANARLEDVQATYARALIPLYGGGQSSGELAKSHAKAAADLAGNVRIELLNPTRESFDDWATNADLNRQYGRRAIPNAGLALQSATDIRPNSGQNLADANLIKIKVTHGYELKVPLAGTVMQFMMRWNDPGTDPFVTELYKHRRIPLVTHVTMRMQSDALEPDNPVSVAGMGNNGSPSDPGYTPPPAKDPPRCLTAGCTVVVDPAAPPASGGGSPPLQSCQPGDPACSPFCG